METKPFTFYWYAIPRKGEFFKDRDNNLQVTILDIDIIEDYFPRITFNWNKVWREYEIPEGIPDHTEIVVAIYDSVMKKVGEQVTV